MLCSHHHLFGQFYCSIDMFLLVATIVVCFINHSVWTLLLRVQQVEEAKEKGIESEFRPDVKVICFISPFLINNKNFVLLISDF